MKPKGFKIGDRVKIKGTALCGEKGSVFEVKHSTIWVLLDGTGREIGLFPSQVIRLVKKKKPLGVKEYEQIIERATNALTEIDGSVWSIKSANVTRQQLANAWDRFVWCNNHHTPAAGSILFEAFCKEIGL